MTTNLTQLANTAYKQFVQLSQDERRRARWIMTPGMWEFIQGLGTIHFTREMWAILGNQQTLLGKPVELRDGVEGIHLEVVG